MTYNLELLKTIFNKEVSDLAKELRATSLQRLLEVSNDTESKDFFNSNKLISSGDIWKDQIEANRRGAPSKAELESLATKLIESERQLKEDYERITGSI